MIKLKNIINEDRFEYKIYCDIDGVLTDFYAQTSKLFGIRYIDTQKEREKLWNYSVDYGIQFWSEMKWLSDGKKLWNTIKVFNPIILSAVPYTPNGKAKVIAEEGKTIWIKNNLGSNVKYILCAGSKEKRQYAKPNTILIDDLHRNINDWNSAGGIGILHTSYNNTIKQLKQYFNIGEIK